MNFTKPCRRCGKSIESGSMTCSFCGAMWPGEMSPEQPMLSRLILRRERTGHLLRVFGNTLAFGIFTVLVVIAAQTILKGI